MLFHTNQILAPAAYNPVRFTITVIMYDPGDIATYYPTIANLLILKNFVFTFGTFDG